MAEVEIIDSTPMSEPISLSGTCALKDRNDDKCIGGGDNDNNMLVIEAVHEQNGVLEVEERDTSMDLEGEAESTSDGGSLSLANSNLTGEDEAKLTSEKVALSEVGNKNGTETTTAGPKKSNLKRPKAETPGQNGTRPSPPKRIRIVESTDVGKHIDKIQLGAGSADLQPARLQGADEAATITEEEACEEKITWLNSGSSFINQTLVNVGYVRDNLSTVKRNFSVEIDMRFILTEAVNAILSSKAKISSVGPSDFHLCVARHSLFNAIPKNKIRYTENFLKMANLDALLNYDLTAPKELISDLTPSSETEGIYYVGDLWHNSKGFREYILSKTSQSQNLFSTKILAMKIKGPRSSEKVINFKAGILFKDDSIHQPQGDSDDLAHLPTEMVEAHKGFLEPQDLLDPETLNSYMNFVTTRSNGKGLHTLIADNPEISFAYESCREVRFQKYFYCECLIALRCLRKGGTFICKVFDSFMLFTTGLLFLLYKCFQSITIHKPASSPSHTSERFLICKGKLDNDDSTYAGDFLFECLDMVVNNQEQRRIVRRRIRKRVEILKMQVQTIVPLKVILSHAEFFQFIRRNNIRLCMNLAESIDELCEWICEERNKDLAYATQPGLDKTLSLWNIHSALSGGTILECRNILLKCKGFLARHNIDEESFALETLVNIESLPSSNTLVLFPIEGTQSGSVYKSLHGFFFGCGGSNILHFNGKSWSPLDCSEFSLPYGTVVLGELAEEICCVGKSHKVVRYFHLFDALFLTETYIGSCSFNTRQQMLSRFVNCLRNSTCSLNERYCVVQPLTLSKIFCQMRSSKVISTFGYRQGRTYLRSEHENRKNWAAVGGFMMFDSCDTSSVKERLANPCLTWLSKADAVDLETSWTNFVSVSISCTGESSL